MKFKLLIFLTTLAGFVISCSLSKPSVKEKDMKVDLQYLKDWGNGVNFQPSYYNGGNPNLALSLLKEQSKIKTIRLEIEPDKVEQAKLWIAQIKAHGYNLICTYHKYKVLGKDDANELLAAANWWKANFKELSASSTFVINLMNEWGSHKLTASDYAKAYNEAIAIVRTVYKGPIIIDISGWGQETYIAYQACTSSNPKILDNNVVLSTHIYPVGWNAGRNHWVEKSDIDDLIRTGRPVIVGEFGSEGNGMCNWSDCVDYAKSKGLLLLGWCWNGDGGGMNMISPAWVKDSTAVKFELSPYFKVVYDKL